MDTPDVDLERVREPFQQRPERVVPAEQQSPRDDEREQRRQGEREGEPFGGFRTGCRDERYDAPAAASCDQV